jgi:hypothetical protein
LIFEYFVFPQFQGSLRNLLGSSLTNVMAPEITRGIRCCYDADASQMQRKGSDFVDFLLQILCYLRYLISLWFWTALFILLCFCFFLSMCSDLDVPRCATLCHQDRFLRSWPSRILRGEPCEPCEPCRMHLAFCSILSFATLSTTVCMQSLTVVLRISQDFASFRILYWALL